MTRYVWEQVQLGQKEKEKSNTIFTNWHGTLYNRKTRSGKEFSKAGVSLSGQIIFIIGYNDLDLWKMHFWFLKSPNVT